jgi:hypothetical protein
VYVPQWSGFDADVSGTIWVVAEASSLGWKMLAEVVVRYPLNKFAGADASLILEVEVEVGVGSSIEQNSNHFVFAGTNVE